MANVKLADCPPTDAELTAYDREHFKLYLRLLDAEAEGADWRRLPKSCFASIRRATANVLTGSMQHTLHERSGWPSTAFSP